MIAEWGVNDATTWARLTERAPWQQHWGYGEAVAATGGRVLRCVVMAGGAPVAVAQFPARAFAGFAHGALCARGPWIAEPGVPAADVLRAIRESVPLPRPRLVILSPDGGLENALRDAGLRQVMTPATLGVIDLTRSPETLRAAMAQKWRNRLSAAERGRDLRVLLDTSPGDAAIAAVMAREAREERAKGYRGLPAALVAAWRHHGGKRPFLLATATLRHEPVATMLFVRHGAGAVYQAGWANEAGRAAGAHPLLLWRAMDALKRDGCARLELGTLDTARSAGVTRFKLGAGARPDALAGSWT
jgi:hypothetical protein